MLLRLNNGFLLNYWDSDNEINEDSFGCDCAIGYTIYDENGTLDDGGELDIDSNKYKDLQDANLIKDIIDFAFPLSDDALYTNYIILGDFPYDIEEETMQLFAKIQTFTYEQYLLLFGIKKNCKSLKNLYAILNEYNLDGEYWDYPKDEIMDILEEHRNGNNVNLVLIDDRYFEIP